MMCPLKALGKEVSVIKSAWVTTLIQACVSLELYPKLVLVLALLLMSSPCHEAFQCLC